MPLICSECSFTENISSFLLSSKFLKMHEIQQLPRHQMHAAGQSVAPQSDRRGVQDRGHDDLDQVGCTWRHRRRLKEFQIR